MDVTRGQVLAHRIARQGLHRDTADITGLAVLDLGVQDAGSGSPRVAVAARLPDGAALEHPDLVTVWAHRGAPHVLRRAEVAALAEALYPRGDADVAARLGSTSTKSLRAAGIGLVEAFATGARALRDVVVGEVSRAEASAAMTAALPAAYSYDCVPCGSRHVFGSLFQLVGITAGVQVLGGRPARLAPLPDRHDLPRGPGDATGFVAAYLRLHGPASPADLAGFLDGPRAVAKSLWPRDLVPVRVDGREAFLPAGEVDALRGAPDARELVRLLPPLDPLLQGRDREVLVPDAARRKLVWRVIGNPGVLLAGGDLAGTWRTKASGARLDITVAPFGTVTKAVRAAVEAEAARVAAARGLREARVTIDT